MQRIIIRAVLMQQAKMIRQTKVWISWSKGIDSKTKGAERRKQRLGRAAAVRMGKFRGPFQRANELKINIIRCFRKAQDEPYKCYEDSIFYKGLKHIRIQPLSFRRAKTAVSSFMVFNCYHDSIRLFYFLLIYM